MLLACGESVGTRLPGGCRQIIACIERATVLQANMGNVEQCGASVSEQCTTALTVMYLRL